MFFLLLRNTKKRERIILIATFFSRVSPQKHQRNTLINGDCNVFSQVRPQNCPQKHQRKGKGNQDCNVFSRVSLATRDKAFLENCHCHGHPHERMQEQRGDSDASDASCDVSDEKRDIHQLL